MTDFAERTSQELLVRIGPNPWPARVTYERSTTSICSSPGGAAVGPNSLVWLSKMCSCECPSSGKSLIGGFSQGPKGCAMPSSSVTGLPGALAAKDTPKGVARTPPSVRASEHTRGPEGGVRLKRVEQETGRCTCPASPSKDERAGPKAPMPGRAEVVQSEPKLTQLLPHAPKVDERTPRGKAPSNSEARPDHPSTRARRERSLEPKASGGSSVRTLKTTAVAPLPVPKGGVFRLLACASLFNRQTGA